jgi:23S rRNA pseudouridine2604 synthase
MCSASKRSASRPEALRAMSEPIRLAKRVAAMVPCSRREAEQYIEGGWVRVDGVIVGEPQHRVSDEQRVELDKGATAASLEPVTVLLHKPANLDEASARQLLAPANRSPQDDSGVRSVKRHFVNLAALLALPSAASGLAVFSQDGRIIRKLTEDAATIEQELVVQVEGTIAENGLKLLCHGLAIGGKPLPPIKVSWQNETRLRFALKGVEPARVPWMCEQVGLRVVAVKRIRIGRLPMAGLALGEWRYLRPGERF